ncbi:MAG: hypothetical protein QOJ79_3067 [Actinomycetota bacterium]|jgi:acetolactate synthase regulatory subunit|nr:hypothetical protein [Actinomycetota bacterium]
MESYLMTVVCRPSLPALARVVSTLHARRAEVTALRYDAGSRIAEVVIDIEGHDGARLAAQLRRVVDVLTVDAVRRVDVAVAS